MKKRQEEGTKGKQKEDISWVRKNRISVASSCVYRLKGRKQEKELGK